MGDTSDLIIDGSMCEQCGVYLSDDDGFPIACPDCAYAEREEEKKEEEVERERIREKATKLMGNCERLSSKEILNRAAGVRQALAGYDDDIFIDGYRITHLRDMDKKQCKKNENIA